MKKLIELNPEWIFENFSVSQRIDGYGEITVLTERIIESNFIRFLLETLKISFVEDEVEDLHMDCGFKFRIEDLKIDCPSMYERSIKLMIKNLEDKLKSANGLK